MYVTLMNIRATSTTATTTTATTTTTISVFCAKLVC